MAAVAAFHSEGSINAMFVAGAAKEAAYRLVENRRVDAAQITAASATASAARMDSDDVIVVLDQSSLSFPDARALRGLGRIGADSVPNKRARGVLVMTGLAVSPRGIVLGLAAQEWLVRNEEQAPHLDRDFRSTLERESVLWIRAMSSSTTSIRQEKPTARITFVADRGADFFGVFGAAERLQTDVIVRSSANRRLTNGEFLHDVVNRSKPIGVVRRRLRIPVENDGVIVREATMKVRAVPVELALRTQKDQRRGTARLTAVQITEHGRRTGERVSWTLLTTWPVTTVEDCIRVVDAYCGRWKIEEFHRTWKRGGKNIERSQLRTVEAIKRWATILAAVAARVERLKTLSREEPSRPAREFLSAEEIFAIKLRSKEKNHHPKDWSAMTIGEAIILIAYFGGWGGRSQGPPGSTILGRGLGRVEEWALVVRAINELAEKK